MPTCPNCGQSNQHTAESCGNCGASLRPSTYVALRPGQQLQGGKYTIVRPLGKGGMGVVYLASQSIAGTRRIVVVKEMLDYYDSRNPEEAQAARARFQKEAATLTTLNHTSIPQVFDYFSEGSRNYIVMQHIEGESLDQRLTRYDGEGNLIKGQPQLPSKVAQWGIQLCRVLEYLAAHQDPVTGKPQPVVHHDIKPANVIIDPHAENVWLVDFGTARARIELAFDAALDQVSGGPDDHQYTVNADGRKTDLGTLPVLDVQAAARPVAGGWSAEVRIPRHLPEPLLRHRRAHPRRRQHEHRQLARALRQPQPGLVNTGCSCQACTVVIQQRQLALRHPRQPLHRRRPRQLSTRALSWAWLVGILAAAMPCLRRDLEEN